MLRRTRGDIEFSVGELMVVADALDVPIAVLLPDTEPQAVAS